MRKGREHVMETALYWITSAAAVIGVWLNIHRRVACFWVWSVTNAVWVYADITHEIYPQAALQFVYFLLALYVYGIWKWGKGDRDGG